MELVRQAGGTERGGASSGRGEEDEEEERGSRRRPQKSLVSLPCVALFASKRVKAGEELCFSYGSPNNGRITNNSSSLLASLLVWVQLVSLIKSLHIYN